MAILSAGMPYPAASRTNAFIDSDNCILDPSSRERRLAGFESLGVTFNEESMRQFYQNHAPHQTPPIPGSPYRATLRNS